MSHIVVTVDDVVVFDNGAQQPAMQARAPSQPQPSANLSAETQFSWEKVGQVLTKDFQPNAAISFEYFVPPFYDGTCLHEILQRPGSPDYVRQLRMWESETPGGAPIDGTLYQGPWSTGGPMTTPAFRPKGGRTYFFNVSVDTGGVFGVQQQHQ